MFSRSRNLHISGGNYSETNIHGGGTRGLELLLDASAPGAFHNSGDRFDPPKCHPNTRVAVLAEIMDWVVGKVGWDGFIMWLYGAAGAGKSAIAQTIAEKCQARNVLLATFFFSRADPNRNNQNRLIPTLAYQVAVNLPQARDLIQAAVENDPAIFHRSVEVQLATLIVEPLIQLSETGLFTSTPVPYVMIVDGLDECQGSQVQQHILYTLSDTLRAEESRIPLMVLIASRPEQPISSAFSTPKLQEITTRLALGDDYQPDADIERYLTDSFEKIVKTHPLRVHIPSAWPTENVIRTLVAKSSGQFIYAATVVKYISSHRHNPTSRLDIVLGLRPSRNEMPFAELDLLYKTILSSVENVPETLRVLGFLILTDVRYSDDMTTAMSLEPGDIERLLMDLASVIECPEEDEIQVLHASFPDFLLDQSRSEKYYINRTSTHTEVALNFLRCLELDEYKEECTCPHGARSDHECGIYLTECHILPSLVDHLCQAKPNAELRQALLHVCYIPPLLKFVGYYNNLDFYDTIAAFLSFLKTSEFPNTEELYFYHRTVFDQTVLNKLATFQLTLQRIFFLVLIESELDSQSVELCFWEHNQYFEAFGDEWDYSVLFNGPPDYESSMMEGYRRLLQELFSDPSRAGEHVLDGPKYAIAAVFLLDWCLCPTLSPNPHEYSPAQCPPPIDGHILSTVLSKASHSEDLIAKLNHSQHTFVNYSNLACDIFSEELEHLVKGIGNYLMRAIGSVPLGLQITYKDPETEEESSYYYDTDSVE